MARWWNYSCLVAGGMSALLSACLSGQAHAQDGALTELYGYGVHRYYAGDLNEAQRVLNLAIDSGIEDPRYYYFRGLTQHKLGMQDAAKADFEFAADLEARGKKAVNIAHALQRIQGPARQEIEMARLMARVAVAQELRAKGQVQADQNRTAPQVTAPPAGVDSALPPALSNEPAAAPTTPPAVPVSPDTQVDPFRDDAVPATPAPATPTTPAPAADPFNAAPPAEPAAPAAADPFAPAPAAPSTPAAPTTPAAPAADPFAPAPAAPATPAAPAGDNPFGT